jgi:DNA-binding CsgD family transcriptional regulator
LTILQSLGCGAVVVQSDGDVIATNNYAEKILKTLSTTFTNDSPGNRLPPRLLAALKASPDQPIFFHIGNARPILVQNIPVHLDSEHSVLIFVDTNAIRAPRTDVLQIGFGLTRCEAALAAALSSGMPPQQIAKLRGVGIGTVRGQLKSVFIKTATTRQSELVALLSRLAVVVDNSESFR